MEYERSDLTSRKMWAGRERGVIECEGGGLIFRRKWAAARLWGMQGVGMTIRNVDDSMAFVQHEETSKREAHFDAS